MTEPADPVRTYSLEEQARLTQQLEDITRRIHAGEFRERRLDITLLRELHDATFRGVRDHAGRVRGPGFGQEYLTFGPNRSAPRNEVERRLVGIFTRLDVDHRALADREADEGYELAAITLAVRAHADIVGVHPFEDGNGRTSRLCASHALVMRGLRPIPIEAVKQEYTAALNVYFLQKDVGPLVDLFIALYPAGR